MKKKLLKICIVGNTNAGKSTLLNNIVGETLSIINKKINTTEDLISGIVNLDNSQLIFYDTPGLSHIKNINKNKLKRNLWDGLNQADIIVYLTDVKKYSINEVIRNLTKLNELKKEIIFVFNKNDLVDKKSILPKIKEIDNLLKIGNPFFSISAKKSLGILNLKKYLLTKAYFSNWIYENNELSNKDDIFITNEITRNNILTLIHKEIPYNVKVSNKVFKYLKNGDLKIKQEISIENIRYKKIILGKNGEKIKEIRVRSQNQINKIFKSKIHLYLNVIKSNVEKI